MICLASRLRDILLFNMSCLCAFFILHACAAFINALKLFGGCAEPPLLLPHPTDIPHCSRSHCVIMKNK
uniref:Expressed protein n=1 Tax=Echinococcus granulosus TaxID=6210 RepID=A0A068WDT6_ECHGR|nr:expressed protein [Echinococcus granulosus]